MEILNAAAAFTDVDRKLCYRSKCGVLCTEMPPQSSCIKFVEFKHLKFEHLTTVIFHVCCLFLQQKIPPATSTLNLSVGMESV